MNLIQHYLTAVILFVSILSLLGLDLPPRPLPPPTPPVEYDTATIQLDVIDWLVPAEAAPWTQVQWLAGDGAWVTVDGWQGELSIEVVSAENDTLQINGSQPWTVGKELYGDGPFRWQLLTSENGEEIGVSEQFHLPTADRQMIIIELVEQ